MDGSFTLRQVIDHLTTKVQEPTVAAIIITLLVVAITTRLTSGTSETGDHATRIAPTPGYWLPYFGHGPQMAWNTDGFLARLRDKYPKGIVSLRLMGKVHTIVHRPSFVTNLMNKPHSVADEKWMHNSLMASNFGISRSDMSLYWDMHPDFHAEYKHLFVEDSLTELVNTTAQNLKGSIADWITFNSTPADQMEWERLADADVIDTPSGETFVEADLMELTKNFVAQTATPSLMGPDFIVNFPDFAQCLWYFDAAFVNMAMKMPSWIPWPALQRARQARRLALSYLYEFNEAMDKELNGEDPGIRWQDLDQVSTLVKARVEVYRKHQTPIRVRAANGFALLWAMNANSSPLVFWMLLEIYRDPVLLEQIRDEISPYVTAIQPKNEFGMGVWISPKIETLDVNGLINNCPLLKSAYVETLRLYTGVWSLKWMRQDTTVKDGGKSGEEFLLKKGTYSHAAHEMHQLDPNYFPNPREWQGARHVKESVGKDGKVVRTADLGTIRPYGTFWRFNPARSNIVLTWMQEAVRPCAKVGLLR